MERSEIPRYVPDASIAVKWFVEEIDSGLARRLKGLFQDGAIDLHAPSLLNYEVASALRFHPAVRFTPRQFRIAMESIDGLQITREPNAKEWTTAFTLSLRNPISIYDAIYVSFAVHSDSKMVTADTTLVSKLKSALAKQKVIVLTDLTL